MLEDREAIQELRRRCVAVVEWFRRAADATVEGGISPDYHPRRGFFPRGHPGATGLVAEVLLEAADALDDQHLQQTARRLLDWLLTQQLSSGAVLRIDVTGVSVLGTARAAIGWWRGAERFDEATYRSAAVQAATWLVDYLVESVSTLHNRSVSQFYALGVLAVAEETTRSQWTARLEPVVEYAVRRLHQPDEDSEAEYAGALADCAWGLLLWSRWTKDRAALKAVDQLLDQVLRALRMDGFLPGRFSAQMEPLDVDYVDVRGALEFARLWEDRYRRTHEFPFRHGALRVLELIMRAQSLRTTDAGRYGAVPGFLPLDRGPLPFSFPAVANQSYLRLLLDLLKSAEKRDRRQPRGE